MIKNKLTNKAKKIFRVSADLDFKVEFAKVNNKIEELAVIVRQLSPATFTIEKLMSLLDVVENYQPVYGLKGLIKNPARSSDDRCKVILDSLGDTAGMQLLDVGASLGYLSFYLADRGAGVQAWEVSPQNAEVARLISQINGIPVDILTRELNNDTAREVPNDTFDAVMILSVFHHIIRFQGLDETKKMVRTLLEKIPVMFVELAKKGEDSKLPWDASQPDDELEIFKGLDVNIKKIGSFGNHLSKNKRPLYMVSAKKIVKVNGKQYRYNYTTHAAYNKSPLRHMTSISRKYYFTDEYIIKEYGLDKHDEKLFNIPEAQAEVATLNSINKLKPRKSLKGKYPEIADFEATNTYSRTVIKRNNGTLLSDLPKLSDAKKRQITKTVLKDILLQLSELRSMNLHHNDIRPWNIMYNQNTDEAMLIDYGNASRVSEQDDVKQLLWSVATYLSDALVSIDDWTTEDLPPATTEALSPEFKLVYEQVKKDNFDPRAILLKTKL